MTIPKKIREQVYQKYNGHCAYCGCKLEYKDMQVDHIVPINPMYPEKDDNFVYGISNLNPSCKLCNHYKRGLYLDKWREWYLEGLIERIRKLYIVRVAEKYGMITFHEWDKKFYFEKCEVEE